MIGGSRRAQDRRGSPARFRRASLLWLGLSAVFAGAAVPGATPSIQWRTETAPNIAVEVVGLLPSTLVELVRNGGAAKKGVELLAVFAEQPDDRAHAMPAMAGTWRVEGEALRFDPAYPFQPGVRYRAEFNPSQLPGVPLTAQRLISSYELPAGNGRPRTVVTQVFPSAAVLPENQLKFYVHFSAPMSRGGIYEHIRLRTADGVAIELPFLEIDEELWDPRMLRLTLLIDPGRIKRGVKPLIDAGPVFEEGTVYALTIGAGWHDASGQPLLADFTKTFRIGPADRTPPDPARWTMKPARVGTREPLIVEFDEPMDRALALRMITVRRGAGEVMEGETRLGDAERRWSFMPARPWERGQHALEVAATIEDLAGNNIGRTFDVDLFEKVERRIVAESVRVVFEVQ